MDAGEEVADVELQVEPSALARVHLAHEPAKAGDGCVRTLADAIGEAVVDEAGLEDLLERLDDQVMHHAIGEGRRVDLAGLGLAGDEASGRARMPGAGIQPALE